MSLYEDLLKEVRFKASRSSGPGGQHVNKVSTRVSLTFSIVDSSFLSPNQKNILLEKLKSRINSKGELSLHCEETPSQTKNKEIVRKRFLELVKEALKPIKKRISTKPSKASKEKRITEKKQLGVKKSLRKYKGEDE